MSAKDNSDQAQGVLARQLDLIEMQINDLLQEKLALQRLLVKLRRSGVEIKDVSRKNSVERILIERRIIDKLSTENRSISAADLYKIAKVVKIDLKDNTFRSYLRRMSDRGLIEGSGVRGHWRLAKVFRPISEESGEKVEVRKN